MRYGVGFPGMSRRSLGVGGCQDMTRVEIAPCARSSMAVFRPLGRTTPIPASWPDSARERRSATIVVEALRASFLPPAFQVGRSIGGARCVPKAACGGPGYGLACQFLNCTTSTSSPARPPRRVTTPAARRTPRPGCASTTPVTYRTRRSVAPYPAIPMRMVFRSCLTRCHRARWPSVSHVRGRSTASTPACSPRPAWPGPFPCMSTVPTARR